VTVILSSTNLLHIVNWIFGLMCISTTLMRRRFRQVTMVAVVNIVIIWY
jgi:hypothetical protein